MLAMSALGMLAVTGCGSASAAPASSDSSAPAAAAQKDRTSYGSDEVDLNVVPHAIFMVHADAQEVANGTPKYKVGDRHDIVAPSTFVVKAGDKITINAWNYDDGQHSMTLDDPSQIPDFNFIIQPGTKNSDGTISPVESTITFTAPNVAKGQILDIAWYCAFPCDGPDHRGMMVDGNNLKGYDGIMAGHIVVMG